MLLALIRVIAWNFMSALIPRKRVHWTTPILEDYLNVLLPLRISIALGLVERHFHLQEGLESFFRCTWFCFFGSNSLLPFLTHFHFLVSSFRYCRIFK